MYVNLTDVADRLGRPISDPLEVAQINAWISDVEGRIADRVRDLPEQVAGGTILLDTVVRLVAGAVIRKVHNPDGLTSTTVSVDDGSVTKRRDGYYGSDPLALTAEEWAELLPTSIRTGWSTRPSFEPNVTWGRP